MNVGQSAAEARRYPHRAEHGPRGDVTDRELVEGPGGNLRKQTMPVSSGDREPHHLVQKRVPLRRDGVAVKEVPASDEHALKLLRCASSLPIRLHSRRGTTTSSPGRSPLRAPTSSSQPRGSVSARCPTRTATAAASGSIRCRRVSSSARACACR